MIILNSAEREERLSWHNMPACRMTGNHAESRIDLPSKLQFEIQRLLSAASEV